MGFLHDVLEKTNKVYDTLDPVYSSIPIAQQVKNDMSRFLLSHEFLFVDVYLSNAWIDSNVEFNKFFFNFYDGKEAICDYLYCRLINEETYAAQSDKFNPLVAIVIATESLLKDEGTLTELRFNSASYTYILYIYEDSVESKLAKLKYNCTGKVLKLPVSSITAGNFTPFIENNVFSRERMKDMQTLFALKTIRPQLQEVYKQILADKAAIEELAIKKDELKEKKDAVFSNNMNLEAANKIKQDLQKCFRDINAFFRNKYSELSLPNKGKFAQTIEALTAQLNSVETRDGNDRFPKLVTSIPKEYIDFFEKNILNVFKKIFNEDKVEVTKRLAEFKSLQAASQSHIPPAILDKISIDYGSFPNPEKITGAYINLYNSKNYSGEMPKMTIQSYLMQVRQQTFFIIMILSLINPLLQLPLVLFSSHYNPVEGDSPDMIAEKYKNRESYSNFTTELTLLFGLATIGLSVYYIIDLKKKIPLMKEELMGKELERVRNNVKQEGLKIFADGSREWLNSINLWLTENLESINLEIDKTITDYNKDRNKRNANLEREHQVALNAYNAKNQIFSTSERLINALIVDQHNSILSLESRIAMNEPKINFSVK